MGYTSNTAIRDSRWSPSPLDYSVVLDATADVMDQYRVVGMPTSFLIDRDGVIRKVHKGFREGDTELLEKSLMPLLSE